MALKFLNKKGWHTGSLRNIEHVWKAEQKHEAEQRKLEELKKQIQDEREASEFRRLQEQAGLVPKQERLEFLYNSGLAVGKSSSDEYLLGKPVESNKNESELAKAAAVPGALFVEEKPHSANDTWRKLHSDPLLLIRQQEQAALAHIKNNPVKMEMIRKSVKQSKKEEKYRHKAEKEQLQKKEKRKKKKSEKHFRVSARESHTGSESDPDMSPRLETRHTEVRSRHAGRHGGTESDQNTRCTEDRSRRENEHKNLVYGKVSKLKTSYSEASGSRVSLNQDHKNDEHWKSRESQEENSKCRYPNDVKIDDIESLRRIRHDVHSRSSRHDVHSPRRRHDSPDLYAGNGQRQGKHEDIEKNERRGTTKDQIQSYIRMNNDLKSKEASDETRQCQTSKQRARHQSGKLSEEEKLARLKEMQADAELHEEQRWQRLKRASDADIHEENGNAVIKKGRNFLDVTTRSVYGAEKGGSASVEESVRRRTHFIERSIGDGNANTFRR